MDRMAFFSITGAINCIGTVLLAIFIYIKNPRSKVNVTCAFFNVSIALWSFGYIFWPIAGSKTSILQCFQILHCGALFISITLFHFVLSLLKVKRPRMLAFGYLSCLFLLPFVFTPLFIADMKPVGEIPYWGVPGPLYYPFLLIFFGYAFYAIMLLLNSYRKAEKDGKNQLKYIIVGIIAGYIGGSTNYMPFFGIAMFPYLNVLVMIYAAMFVYAIVAHQLLDISVIFRKTLVYSVLATILTILYFGSVIILENIFRVYLGYKSFFLSFAVIAAFVIILQPLKRYIQGFIDKLFFRRTIDQINDENIKLRAELEKSERLRSVATLAAGMAHEIKNPLTAIKTFTEYLDKKKNDPQFIQRFQTIVGGEVDRINRIVKQLLEFAKPSDLNLREGDIVGIVDDTLNLLNNEMLRREIKVEKEYSVLPSVKVDAAQIKQVLLNLFLNAMESIGTAGLITVRIADSGRGSIVLSVRDTGKGIDKEDLPHIFDPFFSRTDGGTGLGLSVVHGIVKKHGGIITAESLPGKGATFTIMLPVESKK